MKKVYIKPNCEIITIDLQDSILLNVSTGKGDKGGDLIIPEEGGTIESPGRNPIFDDDPSGKGF